MTKKPRNLITNRDGKAPPHQVLANEQVHLFVDDQNLFFGITNDHYGKGFRIDFGRLMLETCKDHLGNTRGVSSAYIAGVIPDDDFFWEVARNKGFEVRRGYLGYNNRSKQDDAYLIAEIVSTLYEKEGPSTIVLVAGDADYVPALMKALGKGWRVEIAFVEKGVSIAMENYVHRYRVIDPRAIQHQAT